MDSLKDVDLDSIVSIPSGILPDKKNNCVCIIDQTALPVELKKLKISDLQGGVDAVLKMKVRGAPAIALFCVFILSLEIKNQCNTLDKKNECSVGSVKNIYTKIYQELMNTRPTAVNLKNALAFVDGHVQSFFLNKSSGDVVDIDAFVDEIWKWGEFLLQQDQDLCFRMGRHAAKLIVPGASILTHCNTGALATGGIGTAIGAFYTAHGMSLHNKTEPIKIYATETRPLLQGARLTIFELEKAGLDVRLVTDGMPAHLMQEGKIDLVMVGADRIVKNGDTANKIGTLNLAVLCNYYKIPFYIVAPSTTIDTNTSDGSHIIIEQRDPDEVRKVLGKNITVPGISVENPAFDVTPAKLIKAIITENKIYEFPYLFE